MKISELKVEKILSSMGNETIQVDLFCENDVHVTSSVPAGISAGKYEVKYAPVDEAILQVEALKPQLVGYDFNQEKLDEVLTRANVGGNTTLALSVSFWLAERVNTKKPALTFPKLFLLLFEGGKHGNSNITIQEFTIIEDSLQQAIADFKKLKDYLKEKGIESTVGAEGGFSPMGYTNEMVLNTIKEIFPNSSIALDVADSFSTSEVDYSQLIDNYKIASIEDPYSDEEWEAWKNFYTKYGDKILVVGDDLTTTNVERLKMALNPQVINALIIKPNQIGTISGMLQTVKLARERGIKIIVSHRAEETIDDWIVDLALEIEADYMKLGGMDRGERIAKYNRLRELGMK